MAGPPGGDFRDAPWLPKTIVLAIALVAIAGGLSLLSDALGGAGYMAQSKVPRWVGVGAGLMFLLPGIAAVGVFLYGIGVPMSRSAGMLGLLLAVAAAGLLLAIFHWGAFFGAPAFFVVPAALALALSMAGVYDRIERRYGPGVSAAIEPRGGAAATPAPVQPTRPIEHYLGTWINPRMGLHGSHTLEVRAEGDTVSIRALSTCVPGDCVLGEARAEVIRRANSAEIAGLRAEFRDQNGRLSTVALAAEGEDRLRLQETWRTSRGTYSDSVLLRPRK